MTNDSGASAKDGLLARLERGIVRADGSMGYLLTRQGVSRTQSFEFLNLENRALVTSVHRAYIEAADVDLIETNTFGANRFHLATFGREHERLVEVINTAGVQIARAAAQGSQALVGGSIGPLIHSAGDAIPARLDDPAAIAEAYLEQIEALGRASVDCFVIETVHRRVEGITALRVARERFPEIPVIFQVASTERGETVAGDDVETIIREADELGADCVGLNCFLDPAAMYAMILELGQWTSKPLCAQPNLGKRAQLCQGVFEAERSLQTTVRTFASRMITAGVRLIGGCCGITPEHIVAVRDHISKISPSSLEDFQARRIARFEQSQAITVGTFRERRDYVPTGLEGDLRSAESARRPVIVEVDPPFVGSSPEKALEGIRELAAAGVRYISIADNPGRQPRLDRNTFARMALEVAPGIEPILHVSCADMTLVRFATEIDSLHHLSRNILVISGDPPSGDYARSSAPYDLRSVSAIRTFSRRNHGLGLAGQEDMPSTDYFVGGALNPRALEPQMRKFWTKCADAGASFCMTQPLFDESSVAALYEQCEAMRQRLREERGREVFFFPGVMALVSTRNAQILRREFGMPISKSLLVEFEVLATKKEQRQRGRAICREMMALCRERYPFQGLYVVTQFHDYGATIRDLQATGWLASEGS